VPESYHLRAVRPTDANDVHLIATPDSDDPRDTHGTIEWRCPYTARLGGWAAEAWRPEIAEPGLFFKIARSVYDADDALEAFRLYGPLLHDWRDHWDQPRHGTGFIIEERAYDWGYEAARMRHARDLFRALDDARNGSFDKLAYWTGGAQTRTRDEIIREGEAMLIRWINDSLRENVALELRPTASAGAVVLEDRAAVAFEYAPRNLLGSAWLMFARDVIGETTIHECPNCHKYFSVSAGSKRAGRAFCSDKCRNTHWRRMQRAAKAKEADDA